MGKDSHSASEKDDNSPQNLSIAPGQVRRTVSMLFDITTYRRIETAARRSGMSIAELSRRAIVNYLDQLEDRDRSNPEGSDNAA